MPHVGKVEKVIRSIQTYTGAGDLGPTVKDQTIPLSIDIPNGTGLGAANNAYVKEITIAGAGNTDIDLSGGLTGPDGVALVFTNIRYILIQNKSTGVMTVTRPAANGALLFKAAGDGVDLGPGAQLEYWNPTGFTVTPGTGDLINIANAVGTAQKVVLIVMGIV